MPAPVPSGMLRLWLTVQNPVRTVDSLGQASVAWVTIGGVWAHAEQARTAEVIDDGGVSTRSDYRFLCSWHPDLSTNSRFLWQDGDTERTFNIRNCYDRDQRRRRLEVEATEITE